MMKCKIKFEANLLIFLAAPSVSNYEYGENFGNALPNTVCEPALLIVVYNFVVEGSSNVVSMTLPVLKFTYTLDINSNVVLASFAFPALSYVVNI